MNAKVQEFIDKMKKEQEKRELITRNTHLTSLGLVDTNKSYTERKYSNTFGDGYRQFDEEKKLYYKEITVYAPIEVTDEEYQEILKYAPVKSQNTEKIVAKEKETTWANAINVIANILLVINIIGGIILCIILSSDYSTDDFAWIPIVSALTYCILWYPIIVGFSKVVKVAERALQE